MKASSRRAMAVAFAWFAILSLPLLAEQPQPPVSGLDVKSFHLLEIDTSHIKVSVELSLIPAQSVTLSDVRLCSLRLNGLPVFAAPLEQEIVLKKGVATTLPPMQVSLMFRDLYTVEPLRKILAEQTVHVQGELEAGLKLNMVEKLALHTQHPRLEYRISQDVPADVGESPIQRAMGLAMLSVIDSGLANKAQAEKLVLGEQPEWIKNLDAQAAASLLIVETTYQMSGKEKEDDAAAVVGDQLGFRLGAATVLTTAEAREPWKYDLEALDAMKSGAAKLLPQSVEWTLLPLTAEGTKLDKKDFTLSARGEAEEVAAVSNDKARIHLLRRASPSAWTLITLLKPAPEAALKAAPGAIAAQQAWEKIAVFRLRQDPATHRFSSEILQLSAKRTDKGIELSAPVDSAVFGSPIVTPEGVIGMVQDESHGALLPTDLLAPAAPTPAPAPAPAAPVAPTPAQPAPAPAQPTPAPVQPAPATPPAAEVQPDPAAAGKS